MGLVFKMYTDGVSAALARLRDSGTRTEHKLAEQIALDTEKYVPMRDGSLRDRTQVRGNRIIYPGPYARYLYFGKYMVDSKTGKGPAHFFDRNNNEHIKYRKGAKLVPTSRDLRFWHPGTRSHWFDYSKTQNLSKWLRMAERWMMNGGDG